MTHDEYEQKKRALEEQLRAAIEIVQRSHQVQLRALELVRWSESGEVGALRPGAAPSAASGAFSAPPSAAASKPASPPATRRAPGELDAQVRGALEKLPEELTKHDVIRALGFSPDRGSLHRILTGLILEGVLTVRKEGSGRLPSVYRKLSRATAQGS